MRSFPRPLGLLAVAVALGCSADDGVGPVLARDFTQDGGTTANPAMTLGDILLASSGARAKVYCLSATQCYAVAFDFTDFKTGGINGGPYTLLSAYFQNLQGTYPADATGILELDLFHFQFFDTMESPEYVDAYELRVSPVGNVQPGLINIWNNDSPASGVNSDLWTGIGFGIVGCNEGAFASFAFQTCPSEGLDGWVRVDVKLARRGPSASSAPVRFRDFRFSFGYSRNYCIVGGNEPATCTELPYRRVIRP
jgi:hypothetical protein